MSAFLSRLCCVLLQFFFWLWSLVFSAPLLVIPVTITAHSRHCCCCGGAGSAAAAAHDPIDHPPRRIVCRQWEKERAVVLRERAGKAESDKQSLLTSAKDEVNKFYADREAQLQKTQKTNRYEAGHQRTCRRDGRESERCMLGCFAGRLDGGRSRGTRRALEPVANTAAWSRRVHRRSRAHHDFFFSRFAVLLPLCFHLVLTRRTTAAT